MATLSAPTLSELVEEVRENLNQPDSTNSAWSDDAIISYLNRGIRRYFMEVVTSMEGQFTTTSSLDIVSGAELVALPTDFFKMKSLKKKVNQAYLPLHYLNDFNSGFSTQGGTSSEAYLPAYYFRQNNIVLRPIPNFSETAGLLLEYVQFPETMVTGGDSMTSQVSPVFRDLIIAYATWQAKWRESLVTGVDVASMAKDHLNDQYIAFKEVMYMRSKDPVYIQPFNPEAL